MFKANDQPQLFSFKNELGKKQRKTLDRSKEKWFYHLILRNINEVDFRGLCSGRISRPNAPVNVLVSALILKELKGISFDELMESVYSEHFVVVDHEVSSKPAEELNSGMLQSPDDTGATYRQKKGEHYKGFTINGTETTKPENPCLHLTAELP